MDLQIPIGRSEGVRKQETVESENRDEVISEEKLAMSYFYQTEEQNSLPL